MTQQFSKYRDAERITNGLSKLVTLMKDLCIITTTHDIEDKLYCSNAIEKIYNIMGIF